MSNCVSPTKNTKLFIQPVELCTITALKKLKEKTSSNIYDYDKSSTTIFNKNFLDINSNTINSNFRKKEENEFLYTYDMEKKDLCYQINNKDEWNVNCAIQYMNPLYTFDNATNSCTLIPNINYPSGFKTDKEKGQAYIYYDENEGPNNTIYSYQKRRAFCENSWYDWMVVPNFHFGNQYEKDSGLYSKLDVRKCYKPCKKGMFPYTTTKGIRVCIPKTEAYEGTYINKLDFSPISLINMIGNSKETLKDLYTLMLFEKINNYDINELDLNSELFDINKLSIDNEVNNECYPALINSLFTNIVSKDIIDISNFETNTNIISYKNPLFHENEEELFTLRGMSNSGMLNDAILVHTFLLASKYADFLEKDIYKYKNYLDNNKNLKYNFIDEHKFNVKKIIKEKLDAINDNNGGKFNDLKTFYQNDYDTNNLDKYYQRLANIFYKAINICYNNETDFSKNLIIYTQKAFTNINKYLTANNLADMITICQKKTNNCIKIGWINAYFNNNSSFYNPTTFKTIPQDFRLEITFIDIPRIDNKSLIETMTEKLNFEGESVESKEDRINHICQNLQTRICFFTQERIEKKTGCKYGEVPNISDNNKCDRCDTICNTTDKCKENKYCPIYCESNYNNYVTNNANSSGGLSGNKKGKCGDKKTGSESNDILQGTTNKIYDTPVCEGGKMPDFKNILNICIKVIFILIAFYICYIFYQIYGETIVTIINLIYYWLIRLWINIKYFIKNTVAYISGNIDDANSLSFEKEIKNFERQNINDKYLQLKNKIRAIDTASHK